MVDPTVPRRLVLCFDGTGNAFHGDSSDTNVVKIYQMLDRDNAEQFHYYQRMCVSLFPKLIYTVQAI